MPTRDRAVRHHDHPHVARGSSRRPASSRCAGMVFLEDVLTEFGAVAKAAHARRPRSLLPAWAARRGSTSRAADGRRARDGHLLERQHRRAEGRDADAPQHPGERRRDRAGLRADEPTTCMLGVLPFFHSFGFTGTLWFPLLSGFGVVYHPNPMDAKTIGELAARYRGDDAHQHADLLLRRTSASASREQFAHLRYAIVGAEKLREPIAAAFKEKFGIDAARRLRLHGDGAGRRRQRAGRRRTAASASAARAPASVGHPLPGVAAKVVDPETGEGPLFGQEGLLLVKGPNRMLGYLGEPEQTRRGAARRLVRDRRHRDDRRRRLHPHHRSAVALQQDRRRDGAAHEDRGADPGAARRPARLRRHVGAGRRRRASGSSRSTPIPT